MRGEGVNANSRGLLHLWVALVAEVALSRIQRAKRGRYIGELHQSAEFMGVSLATEQYLLPIVAGAHAP